MANVFLSNYPGSGAGNSIAFNPQADVLAVDNTAISASQLQIVSAGTNVTVSATVGGQLYQVTLQNVLLNQLTTTNVQFFDGSQLLVGDNSPQLSSVPDDQAQTIVGTGFNDQVYGLGGADTIDGGVGSDLIYGNLGNDSITGTAGSDTIYGGKGDDLINYSGAAGVGANNIGIQAAGNVGNDVIYGGTGNDLIFGNQLNSEATNNDATFIDGNDSLYGGAGSDTIYGNQGDDLIVGRNDTGTQTDLVFGGRGNDTIDYSTNGGNGATIYGNLGSDTIFGSSGLTDIIYGDSDATSTGAPAGTTGADATGNDVIVGGASVRASVYAGFGNDVVNYSGQSTIVNIEGGSGSDTIYGSNGGDSFNGPSVIYGGSGAGTVDSADLILAGAGFEIIYGNQGNDTIVGVSNTVGVNDVVFGGEGNDQINYSASTNGVQAYGGRGNDVIYGSTASDTLIAGQGADALIGNATGAANTAGNGDTYDFSTAGNGGAAGGTFIDGTTTLTADTIRSFTTGTSFTTGVDQLITGLGAGNSDNYQEFANTAVNSVESAVTLYTGSDSFSNPVNPLAPSYTFIAGATDGYLIVDQDGVSNNGTAGVGVLTLQGLGVGANPNSNVALANFNFSDVVG